MAPVNLAEKIVWYSIVWLYPCYLIGALYLTGPIIGWTLFLIWMKQVTTNQSCAVQMQPSVVHIIWAIGMLVMLLALVIGHLNYEIGLVQTIKSSIGWAKGWALLALFIFAGLLPIRSEMLVRACMHLSLHTLLLLPLFVSAWLLGLPQTLYTSPLAIIGGPGPEFFSVSLYEVEAHSSIARWRLFTPWAPALGFIANIIFIFALEERSPKWRRIGIAASVLMILMSQSRLASLCLIAVIGYRVQLIYLKGHALAFCLAITSLLLATCAEPAIELTNEAIEQIKSARADSTRVREILARIAIERWSSEAPIWGHGTVANGPHLVEYMPIGSHHTWYGLLYVKGLVGLMALLLPLLTSFINLLSADSTNPLQRMGLLCCCVITLFTLGENLEILAYLYWPGLLIIGLAHSAKSKKSKANILTNRSIHPSRNYWSQEKLRS